MQYINITFAELKLNDVIAFPKKGKTFYLSKDGYVREVSAVVLFKIVNISKNKISGTFTVEVEQAISVTPQKPIPLIFKADTEVFKVIDFNENEKVHDNLAEDKRKVIKGWHLVLFTAPTFLQMSIVWVEAIIKRQLHYI